MMQRLFSDVLVCRASRVQLKSSGAAEPSSVPGCGCVVARGAAAHFAQLQRCGLCKRTFSVPPQAGYSADVHRHMPVNAAALQLVRYANAENVQMPILPAFQLYGGSDLVHFTKADRKHNDATTCGVVCDDTSDWCGADGRFCHVKQKWPTCSRDAVVRSVTFPSPAAPIMFETVNGVLAQHLASLVSDYVAPVGAFEWCPAVPTPSGKPKPAEARIAMPGFIKRTLKAYLRKYSGPSHAPTKLQILLKLFAATACAVLSIHSFGFVHGGLSTGTIMLDGFDAPLLTDFSRSHRHRSPSDLQSCTAAGCVSTHIVPREMQGHVCAAADVHDLGHTFASAVAMWLGERDGDVPEGAGVEFKAICARVREQVNKMVNKPGGCCLVQVSAAFDTMRTDLPQ